MSASGYGDTSTTDAGFGVKRFVAGGWRATIRRMWGFSRRRSAIEPQPESAPERGVCAFWHQEEGWGAVTTPNHPGLGFVHFSDVRDMPGYRELVPGSTVDLAYAGPYPHDGCDWRVAWVRRTE